MIFSLLWQSIGIAINRNVLQLASILITALLGLSNEQTLAQFSLALSYAAIYFIVMSSIQLGLLSEFSQCYAAKNDEGLIRLFFTILVSILIFSVLLVLKVWFSPNPFINSNPAIKFAAFDGLKILVISLPFVGLLTTITYFLEGIGSIAKVTQLRLIQFFLQISMVMIVLWFKSSQPQLKEISLIVLIASAYVLSDMVMFIIGLGVLYFEKNKIKWSFLVFVHKNGFILNELTKIITFGMPVMLGVVGQKIIFYLCTEYCTTLGVWQTFAFTVMNSIVLLFQLPLMGLSNLLTIKIGFLRGEKKFTDLDGLTTQYRNLYAVEALIIATILYIFYGKVVALFTTDAQTIQHLFDLKPYFMLFFIMNFLLTFNMGALRGFSDNFIPQLIILVLLAGGVLPWLSLSIQINLEQMIVFMVISGVSASCILYRRLKYNLAKISSIPPFLST